MPGPSIAAMISGIAFVGVALVGHNTALVIVGAALVALGVVMAAGLAGWRR